MPKHWDWINLFLILKLHLCKKDKTDIVLEPIYKDYHK